MSDNNQTKRARWHDYRSRCIYMLTLSKRRDSAAFGRIAAVGGTYAIELSPLGKAVRNAVFNIDSLEPAIRLLQYAMMPDHVHLLLHVQRPLAEPLGNTIARLKIGINRQNGGISVFDEGFNDQILHSGRSLDVLFRYLRDNPRRLAVRQACPERFRRVNGMEVCGRNVQAYGNLFLLHHPFKEQVVIHRADSAEKRMRNRERWLYTASNGGVLVSPFISSDEKAVRAEAEAAGARIIIVTNEPMGPRWKPAAHDFALCEEGRLLILSTGTLPLTRATCMEMNSLCQKICTAQSFSSDNFL